MLVVGQVRIVAESEQAVRVLAQEMSVALTSLRPGRDGGWIGYGTRGVVMAVVSAIKKEVEKPKPKMLKSSM